jgi:hypothetical protein
MSVLCLMMLATTGFAAGEIPNLVGVWSTSSEGGVLVHGQGVGKTTHWEMKQTSLSGELTVKEQNGRVLSGEFASPRGTEPFIAVIGHDGRRVYFADMDGYLDAVIVDPDTIEMIYRHVTATDTVAAVGVWKRKK